MSVEPPSAPPAETHTEVLGGRSSDAAVADREGDRPLIVRDVVVRHLPRMLSINAMMAGKPIQDMAERPFQPWPKSTRRALIRRSIQAGNAVAVSVGNARNQPYVLRQVAGKNIIDLFPATTMYITARVIDPNAQRWDPSTGRFVAGPVESRLYYQIAGRRLPLEARAGRR